MKLKLATAILALLFLFAPSDSLALSKYGLACDLNDDCVECRNEDRKCSICMNKCWNKFDDPESPKIPCKEEDKWCNAKYRCKQRQSKWCHAQCWDPDDTTDKKYVSTMPNCDKYRKRKKKKKKKSD